MPSSFSFLLNSSSSSSESDSKSDETDDDINIGYYKKRTIENDNDMLECPSDNGDSRSCSSQSDVTDIDDDEKENDRIPSLYDPPSHLLPRQLTLYDDDDQWTKKSARDKTKLFQQQPVDDDLIFDSSEHRVFSPERSQSVSIVDKTYQSRNNRPLSPSDFTASAQELRAIPEPDSQPMTTVVSKTKPKTMASPIKVPIKNEETRRPVTKIPIRTNSSSPSRSRSPAVLPPTNRRVLSPTGPSRIPIPISTMSKGAFHFFTADDRPVSQLPSTGDSIQATKQLSPFTPITAHPKKLPLAKKSSSSAGNTPSLRHQRVPVESTDEEEDAETNNLKEGDLKLKLKEQKRHGKQTGEILNKLHENYEELLEKYAQAENTIDQLRFQPRFFGDNTPPSNTSEGAVHLIQQPKVNLASLRSSGVYRSMTDTPISSLRQVPSTTTTTTTPVIKSASPTNSGTVESVFFDEPASQTIIVQELTSPETIKLDLLIQTKTLSEKMKSFLTLMDANQLSLAEQKQVYESIKDDYEKLLKAFDRTKRGGDLSDIDLDADLNQQLEMMKQLLKEIVKRITDNLLGKSSNGSETGRQSRLTHDGSQSSQVSVRSSLCNHADLMEQYQKLLSAVNTGAVEQKNGIKSSGVEQLKKTISRDSSQSDTSGHRLPTTPSQKPCVYVSGNSDNEQEQRSYRHTPVPLRKGTESTPFDLDYIPSKASKHHQQLDEQQTHIRGTTMAAKKKKIPVRRQSQEYDNLDMISKTKRKTKVDSKKLSNQYQAEKESSPSSLSMPTGHGTRYSTSSMRTRTSDYDSGIGTNNTTKLSRDSKLNTSTMDESHYQSLDDDQRRYSDEEQESMSSVSSSRSSGSGAANPRSLYSKYAKRFGSSSSLKRRKPSGHSDVYSSDVETHLTGSFDPLPASSPYSQERTRRSHHSWQPQRTDSRRSRLTASHRSISRESNLYQAYPHRPQTAPQISSSSKMGKQYQSGFVHHQTTTRHPQSRYQSSFYIDQSHTHRRSQERLNQDAQQKYDTVQTSVRKQPNNLYLDSRTGVIYRYVPTRNQQQPPSALNSYQPATQVKSSRELYQCAECGSVTTYQHRHHIDPNVRRIGTDVDDPGYESGNRKFNRHLEHLTSSDSDLDETRFDDFLHRKSSYLDLTTLNEAYERARKVQHRSQNLSKHISRQLKLVLATM